MYQKSENKEPQVQDIRSVTQANGQTSVKNEINDNEVEIQRQISIRRSRTTEKLTVR